MPTRDRLLAIALKGLESDRAAIDQEIVEIRRELGRASAGRPAGNKNRAVLAAPAKRRAMSAEARRRISEGMKRRYMEMRKALAKK